MSSPAATTPPSDAVSASAPPVTEGEALRFWFKLGCISFGGPAGQIALMHEELVQRRRWISEGRFLHALNYCMVLPGPEAQQLATYIGWLMHGVRGGLVAGGLFVLPSLLLLVALSWIYMAWGQTAVVAGLFYGIKPAVTAIVAQAAWRIGSRTLRRPLHRAVAVGAFVAVAGLHLPYPAIIGLAALVGWAVDGPLSRWVPAGGSGPTATGAAAAGHAPGHPSGRTPAGAPAPAAAAASSAAPSPAAPSPADPSGDAHRAASARVAAPSTSAPSAPPWIDDHSPTPPHAHLSITRVAALVAVGVMLGLAGLGLLTALFGWQGGPTQMARFFTQAALLTFGGAYAVLPYVTQAAVQQFHWLSLPQMIDGLALGETTPGPLIMVVAFVGFAGGWHSAGPGSDPAVLAVTGALVATAYTFLPSFVFILAGGPVVESTRAQLRLGAPLAAITAAVVGLITSLALFFAAHVLWPHGLADGLLAGLDAPALALMLAAGWALLRGGRSVVQVITVSAAVGLLIQLVRPVLGT